MKSCHRQARGLCVIIAFVHCYAICTVTSGYKDSEMHARGGATKDATYMGRWAGARVNSVVAVF